MINGRAKGHAFERELIKMFQDEFGDCANHLKRNLDQYQTAGKADIEFHIILTYYSQSKVTFNVGYLCQFI